MKPDLITVWPRAFDYPLFRELIVKNRDLFNKVIIVFTHNSVVRDYREFLKITHPDWTFCDTEQYISQPNWYTHAILEGLKESDKDKAWIREDDWVLFMEQDFIFNEGFLKRFLEQVKFLSFGGLSEPGRLYHFGCFAVKRRLIENTVKFFESFEVLNYKFDCFDFFILELTRLSNQHKSLDEMGFIRGDDYDHLSGLTHNYHLLDIGKYELMTGKEKLRQYNDLSNGVTINIDYSWIAQMIKMKEVLDA